MTSIMGLNLLQAAHCAHCGAEDFYPAPGAFAVLAGLLGLSRHCCRACRRHFWRLDPGPPPLATGAEAGAGEAVPAAPPESTPIDAAALDFLDEAAALAGPLHDADLGALDRALARLRRDDPPRRKRRGSRARETKVISR